MKFKNLAVKILICGLLFFMGKYMSYASVVVLNGLTHEQISVIGGSYKGTIEIQNTAEVAKSVKVYQRDYLFNYAGESRHDVPGELERSNAGWITFNPELMNLAPGQKAVIDYEVKVPEVDSLKGTYWSVLMVEGILPPDTSNTKKGVTINTNIRYAVQIVTTLGNSGVSDLQFLGLEIAKEDAINILNVVVENTGERQLRPEIALELFNEKGNSAGVIKSERRKTFPGTSIMATLFLEGIKPGKYTGVLVADCDEDHVFGTNVSFEIE